nr:hypothetical protein [Treponemataceae bacterium]
VTSLSPEGYTVYWFDKNGALKWKIPVLNSYLPEPESDEAGDYFVTIDKIVPDQNTPTLYIKTDYYKTVNDQELNVQSGIEYKMTLLHVFDIEKESFDSPIEIPPYEDVITDRFTKLVYKVPYEFLGITDSNAFFFMVPGSQGLVLEILQGQKIIKRHISYNMNDVVYTNFSLSKTGIISGLIAKEDKADVVWWRTDSLVEKH